MKKIILLITFFLAAAAGFYFFRENNDILESSIKSVLPSENIPQKEINYIFVPYWTMSSGLDVNSNDELLYFGVTINDEGIDKSDEGYLNMNTFVPLVAENKKYLTLRILKGNADEKILEDIDFQKKVGGEIAVLAKENNFDGVVVDYETSAFGFLSTEKEISELYKSLSREIKGRDLEFLVTVFGDTFYRGRPYNISEISSVSDKIIIMAYDFHKARLNPGPNFPLSDEKKYGYSFKKMIDDFLKETPYEKIVVALGYFGYDWTLGIDGVSVGMAEPLSLNQIEQRYFEGCPSVSCAVSENSDLESVVKYTDSEGFSHEVWFENEKSANKKIKFLNSKGINQIASWAYSYY